MKLLLTVDGIGDRSVQVAESATIGEVVAALRVDGSNGHGPDQRPGEAAGTGAGGASQGRGLLVVRTGLVSRPDEPVVGSDLRSGDRVAIVDPDGRGGARWPGLEVDGADVRTRSRTWRPAAVLKILSGPASPAALEIPFGEVTIGRGEDNDLVIPDSSLSRVHATVRVDDASIEITDQGSSNGVVIDGTARSGPVSLLSGSRVLMGRTWIEVEHLGRPRGLGDLGQHEVEFNRPPRLVEPYEPRTFTVPTPPDHPPRQRIPKLAAIAPLLMGGAMIYLPVLLGGRPNYLFGMFMLFSPMMLMASFFEGRSAGRATFREELARFDGEVADLETRLAEALAVEQAGRREAAPAAAELAGIVETLSPRLWERAIDDPDVLSVRIGLADQPSQNVIETNDRGPADLRQAIDELPARFAEVDAVPAIADLVAGPGLGVSGPREFTTPLCHAVVAQLATLHSPAELLLTAMVPAQALPDWEWMKWLPHCPPDDSPIGGRPLAADEGAIRGLLQRLLTLIETRLEEQSGFASGPQVPLPAIVVVIGEGLPLPQHELTRLLERGPAAGVFVIWQSGASRRVPRGLGNVVTVEPDGRTAALARTGPGELVAPVLVEPLGRLAVESLARGLSPIEDVSSRFASAGDLPGRVDLVDLLGGPEIRDRTEAALRAWRHRPKTLEAPVGRTVDGVFALDIRRDGPHALVGGTTGAGKSEFLQSWVMGLAATHGPDTVTFLLVDYKGGAAFKDCSKLPHTVGMVTDLDGAGVRRALVSLEAELRHREEVLAEHDCSDLLEMIDDHPAAAPPSLLIVVDEFAALVQEVPEFVDGVVQVAQRGRSLGLHLVLATQRPSGVITGQVKANTDLRIALRMADAEDSTDVIGSPEAAEIDRAFPGRGIVSISRRHLPFQSAYVGGVSSAEEGVAVEVGEFGFDGIRPIAIDRPAPATNGAPQATDLELLVANFVAAHRESGRPLPRKPWLAPLAPTYDLAGLPGSADSDASTGRSDARLAVGVVDVPHRQAQEAMVVDLDVDGSLAIVGAGGSGKTVALRTICAAAADHDGRPEDTPVVHVLDFAGRGLRMVDQLPHVSGVVADDDPERARRVLADIEVLLDRRTAAFAEVLATSLPEYRAARPDEIVPRTLLLIDGYPAFHELFEPLENERWIRVVRRLIQEGRAVGIHVVVTAPRRETIVSPTARALSRWLLLRQTSTDDYRSLEVPADLIGEGAPAGRAIEGGNLAQVAVLGGSGATEVQAEAMAALARDMVGRGVPTAPPIRLLPDEVDRRDLDDPAAFAQRDRDFAGQRLPDRHRVLLITGPRSSGRSTALVGIGRAAARRGFDEVVHLGPKPSTVSLDPGWRSVVGLDQVNELLFPLLPAPADGLRRLLLIDDAQGLSDLGAPIDQVVEACDGTNLAMVIVLDDTKARSGYDPLARAVVADKLGLLLRPSPLDDSDIFGIPLPRVRSHLWPVGRGYLIDDRSVEIVQVAR